MLVALLWYEPLPETMYIWGIVPTNKGGKSPYDLDNQLKLSFMVELRVV
jgi:hypothetical protein